jgi:hypothetical protein
MGAERAGADTTAVAKKAASGILDDLPKGSSALVLVIEHRWMIPLRDAVRDAGGLLLAHRSVSVAELIALGVAIAEPVGV